MKKNSIPFLLVLSVVTAVAQCSKEPISKDNATSGQTRYCPTNLPGPTLIEVSAPNGTKYCIDATEVTQSQYAEFVANVGDSLVGRAGECDGNMSWVPIYDEEEGSVCNQYEFTPEQTPDQPMGCVDWCDAFAYCHWAGKRLCGQIGGGDLGFTAPNDTSSALNNPNIDQWYNACSQGGTTVYATGNSPPSSTGACTAGQYPLDNESVENSQCKGASLPWSLIIDLSGNLVEWTAACSGGACAIRGTTTSNTTNPCTKYGGSSVLTAGEGFGFRCCHDLVKPREDSSFLTRR